jgi:cytoskeletal protein RodZ
MVRKKSNKYQRLLKNRKLLIALAVLILALGLWQLFPDNNSANSSSGASDTTHQPYVNLNPPTDQEKSEAEAHKKDLANSDTPVPATGSNGKKSVTPVITNASTAEVDAYIPGVFEDGGTCTATLIKGTQTIVKISQGFANATYTSCAPIILNNSVAGTGWTVVVSYNSSTAEGQTAPVSVNK